MRKSSVATSFCRLPHRVADSIRALRHRALHGMVIGRNKKLSAPRPRTESVLGSGLYIQCSTSPPFTHMYDRRSREMYYVDEKQKQMDPRTVFSLDLFRVDSECVFGVVMCLGHGNIKNDRQQTPFTQVQIIQCPPQNPSHAQLS
jgi:hypothetical protein